MERGVPIENTLVAVAGLTQQARKAIESDGLEVIGSFMIPTIDQEFSEEETQAIEELSAQMGFYGGGERILTFLFHKVSDNFWQPLKKTENESTYLIDNTKIQPPYYSNPKDLVL